MCLSISSLIVLGSGGQIWGLGKKDERTNLKPRRYLHDIAFYANPSVRLPSSPDIAAALSVSCHAARKRQPWRATGARRRKTHRVEGVCGGGAFEAKSGSVDRGWATLWSKIATFKQGSLEARDEWAVLPNFGYIWENYVCFTHP
jgi:hypothetical protein